MKFLIIFASYTHKAQEKDDSDYYGFEPGTLGVLKFSCNHVILLTGIALTITAENINTNTNDTMLDKS